MTIQQMRYVVMVAEKGTISDAAKALFISQPSLTNAIKEIEKELNIQIFLRTNKGVVVSNEGDEFLGYARQVLEQMDVIDDRYKGSMIRTQHFSVSTQHYSFAVRAFVDLIKTSGHETFDYTLRETQTHEIIEDVSKMRSEIGVLYLSDNNETVLKKMMNQYQLNFEELFVAKPHVFISSRHPLRNQSVITIDELEPYPYLTFEQGAYNSFYFSEEILSTLDSNKNIKVRDRATLFNLLIGLNGYTVSTGIIDEELNGADIISKELALEVPIRVGILTHKKVHLTSLAEDYIKALKKHVGIKELT